MSYIEGSELEKESWKSFFKFLGDDVKEKMERIAKTYLESEEKIEVTKEPEKKPVV